MMLVKADDATDALAAFFIDFSHFAFNSFVLLVLEARLVVTLTVNLSLNVPNTLCVL